MGPYLALRFFLTPAPLLLFGKAFYTNGQLTLTPTPTLSPNPILSLTQTLTPSLTLTLDPNRKTQPYLVPALINLALADVVSNLHSFLVISTNHAGEPSLILSRSRSLLLTLWLRALTPTLTLTLTSTPS